VLTQPQLIAAYFTLAGNILPLAPTMASPISLADRARAAARAGYAGIGLHSDDMVQSVQRHGYAGVRGILDDSGLKHLEIEALLDWFVDGERRRSSDAVRKIMLDGANHLRAFQIKVTGDLFGGEWPIDRMAREFSTLCRQASDVGANVCIEVLPFSNIRDLSTALEIVAGADAPNGGLLIDIWHMARGGIPFDQIASIPARHLKHIEIDDADEAIVGTLLEDTIRNRRLPGEGSFDIPTFLTSVMRTGYQGFYGVEILSDEHRLLPPDEAARRSFDATMAQFTGISAGPSQASVDRPRH
jgi:sugar phosphate isomerase/epimerase